MRSYVNDLKELDVPTARAEVGGVMVTVTHPKDQPTARMQQCPSCGARADRLAVRGQSVRCTYCGPCTKSHDAAGPSPLD